MKLAMQTNQERVRREPREYSYERLMQVSIYHSYYNAMDYLCPDFAVYPSPTTARLMQSLGLIFKDEGTGFSIFYNVKLQSELIEYLRRMQGNEPIGLQVLSFALAVTDPEFVTYTRIPIRMNPLRRNFYFSNRWAHGPVNQCTLNQGEYVRRIVKQGARKNYLRVIPSQYAVDVSKSVSEVEVFDISGKLVACAPRCVPKRLVQTHNPATITCKDVKEFVSRHPDLDCRRCPECKDIAEPGQPCCYCRDEVFFEFALLPQGRYTIVKKSTGLKAGEDDQQDVLYTRSSPTPFCFVDLLFSKIENRVETEGDGVYPIPDLWADLPAHDLIRPVHYELRFESRKTIWKYLIVPRGRPLEFYDLRIEAQRGPAAEFGPAIPVELPNGQPAFCIESLEPLELQQRSRYHLQLKGRRGELGLDRVIIAHLPVTSIGQVTLTDWSPQPYSEIYVYI